MEVLLRFKSWKYGIVSDIEKAFLQIAVDEEIFCTSYGSKTFLKETLKLWFLDLQELFLE